MASKIKTAQPISKGFINHANNRTTKRFPSSGATILNTMYVPICYAQVQIGTILGLSCANLRFELCATILGLPAQSTD